MADSGTIRILNSIPSLGLTEYGVRALIALADGEKTSTAIGQIAGIPRTKTYEVLNELLAKELIIKSKEEPLSYKLVEDAFDSLAARLKEDLDAAQRFLEELSKVRIKGYEKSILDNLSSALESLGCRVLADLPNADLIAISPQGFKICTELVLNVRSLTLDKLDQIRGFQQNNKCDVMLVICTFDLTDLLERSIGDAGAHPIVYDPTSMTERIRQALSRFEEIYNLTQTIRRELEPLIENIESRNHELISSLLEMRNLIDKLDAEKSQSIREEVQARLTELKEQTAMLHDLRYLSEQVLHEPSMKYNLDIIKRLEWAQRETNELAAKSAKIMNDVSILSSKIEDIKKKRPSPLYLGIIPPVNIVSDEYIIDQVEFRRSVEHFIQNRTTGSSIAFIEGVYGSGKTLFMIYYSNKINRGDFGKHVAVYTTFEGSFLQMLRSLILKLSAKLEPPHIPTELSSYHGAFRELQQLIGKLREQGFEQIIWFLDEFEKYISYSKMKRIRLMESLRSFFDMSFDLSLKLLLAAIPQGITEISRENPAFMSRIPATNIFRLRPFSREDVYELIKRLKIEISFNDSVIDAIIENSLGNARRIVIYLADLKAYADQQNVKVIDIKLFHKLFGTRKKKPSR